ncbi:hypothetical protein NBRC116587_02600 [Pseudoteredinibacter isoporae]
MSVSAVCPEGVDDNHVYPPAWYCLIKAQIYQKHSTCQEQEDEKGRKQMTKERRK